jgi:hypothetical protein
LELPTTQTSRWAQDAIVALREELVLAGLDHGATTIQWHLGQRRTLGELRVPSIATIHRVLVRCGVVEPQPRKRPKSSWKRFEAPAPNEYWQIDAMDWTIATGLVKVFNIIDDHSRVVVRSRVVTEATDPTLATHWWEVYLDLIAKIAGESGAAGQPVAAAIQQGFQADKINYAILCR